MNILHQIAHWLGLNKGNPYSFYQGDKLMMSFKCGHCGKLEDTHCVDKLVDSHLKEKGKNDQGKS